MTNVPGMRPGAPIEAVVGLGVVVAGDERHGRAGVAVGDGNPRVGRDTDTGRYPRDDDERHPFRAKVLGLLAAPAEDERVAPLEADHAPAAPGVLDEKAVDLVLRDRVPPRGLARADPFGPGGGQVEEPSLARWS